MTQNNKALIENSKSSKHTPTPWMMQGYQNNGYNIGTEQGPNYEKTAWANSKANAAFIIKAYNSHKELIKLVKQLTGYLLRNGFSNAIGDEQELIKLAQETIRRTEKI